VKEKQSKTHQTWRPPTRRMFVAMISAAAASVAIRTEAQPGTGTRDPTRWIGHF
jgi:hypothetical protein